MALMAVDVYPTRKNRVVPVVFIISRCARVACWYKTTHKHKGNHITRTRPLNCTDTEERAELCLWRHKNTKNTRRGFTADCAPNAVDRSVNTRPPPPSPHANNCVSRTCVDRDKNYTPATAYKDTLLPCAALRKHTWCILIADIAPH